MGSHNGMVVSVRVWITYIIWKGMIKMIATKTGAGELMRALKCDSAGCIVIGVNGVRPNCEKNGLTA